MIYRVTARFKTETAGDLLRRLDEGSIAAQQPDGQEIVASLHRAVVTGANTVRWTERCFCDPPLAHERETILDRYFGDITTEPVEDYERYAGKPFVEHLKKLQENKPV